ncbi:unnamed protein product [Toxocara canis]|uniref:Transmembrane protein n=1 Tax=Toxocara canis TaxID=6265 RepID=A0A183VB40_TOXCA|nr:unnamed protein product [Toxocara canis]
MSDTKASRTLLEMQLRRVLVTVDAAICCLLGVALFFAPGPIGDLIFVSYFLSCK